MPIVNSNSHFLIFDDDIATARVTEALQQAIDKETSLCLSQRWRAKLISAPPGNLTQETIINYDSDDNMAGDAGFCFEDKQEVGIPYDSGSCYTDLHPVFKELCAVMDLNHTEDCKRRYLATMNT